MEMQDLKATRGIEDKGLNLGEAMNRTHTVQGLGIFEDLAQPITVYTGPGG